MDSPAGTAGTPQRMRSKGWAWIRQFVTKRAETRHENTEGTQQSPSNRGRDTPTWRFPASGEILGSEILSIESVTKKSCTGREPVQLRKENSAMGESGLGHLAPTCERAQSEEAQANQQCRRATVGDTNGIIQLENADSALSCTWICDLYDLCQFVETFATEQYAVNAAGEGWSTKRAASEQSGHGSAGRSKFDPIATCPPSFWRSGHPLGGFYKILEQLSVSVMKNEVVSYKCQCLRKNMAYSLILAFLFTPSIAWSQILLDSTLQKVVIFKKMSYNKNIPFQKGWGYPEATGFYFKPDSISQLYIVTAQHVVLMPLLIKRNLVFFIYRLCKKVPLI